MKIKEGFILKEVAGNYIVVSVGERVKEMNCLINLNSTGAFLWKLLEKGAETETLVNALTEKYGIDKSVAEKDVATFLNKATEAKLLD